jgi:hypothetical protein
MFGNYIHPDFQKASPDWHRIHCAIGGRSEVLAHISDFMPMTEALKSDPGMLRIYVERAGWYGGAAKTLDAWVGVLCRKPLTVEVPANYRRRMEDIDGEGTDIDAFARKIVRAVCGYGRCGILVDASSSGFSANPNTLPYLTMYGASNIVSWRTRRSPTRGRILDQVILRETNEVPHESGFGVSYQTVYRVLELDDQERYRIRVFTEFDGGFAEADPIYPIVRNYNMNYVPFVFVGPSSTSPAIEKSPLMEVVDANFSHWLSSADFHWSLFWTASPTVVVTGLSPEDTTPLRVGGGSFIKLPAGATATYLESMGPGLPSLHESMLTEQQAMANLGASLLNTPKRATETAEALTIKSNGESASLVTIADTVGKALTQALKFAIDWEGDRGKVSVTLNRDLVNVRLTPDDMRTLVAMVQAGLLSLDDFYYNLQSGEILRPGVTVEDAKAAAQMSPPALSVVPTPPTPITASRRTARSRDKGPTDTTE